MRTDGNGNFIIKRIYVLVTFILLLISVGYSFGVTFRIQPLEKRVSLLEPIVSENAKTASSILIHMEYIKAELNKLSICMEKIK